MELYDTHFRCMEVNPGKYNSTSSNHGMGMCFDVNEELPIYENSSVVSAAEFWLSRSFSYIYPGESVGLFEGCQQFEEKDSIELQRFFTIVAKNWGRPLQGQFLQGPGVFCVCSPSTELSFPNFQRAKIFCSFDPLSIQFKHHIPASWFLFSISELRILQESHPDFNMSFCPTVEGFNERILKVINEIRGHNRTISSSSSNEKLVQIAKNYLFTINVGGAVDHYETATPAAVFLFRVPATHFVGDFYIDDFVDAAVSSWKKDYKNYSYPGENRTLELCGLNKVPMSELRWNRFLMMVSEATTDIKCEALDYIHPNITKRFMIACAFQQDQFQPLNITGDVIFTQSEFEKLQKLGVEIDVCPEVTQHNIENSSSRGLSRTIKHMILFLFHFFFCIF